MNPATPSLTYSCFSLIACYLRTLDFQKLFVAIVTFWDSTYLTCVFIQLFAYVLLSFATFDAEVYKLILFPATEAKVEQDEEEEVRRAKYFIRDEFLVCSIVCFRLFFIRLPQFIDFLPLPSFGCLIDGGAGKIPKTLLVGAG